MSVHNPKVQRRHDFKIGEEVRVTSYWSPFTRPADVGKEGAIVKLNAISVRVKCTDGTERNFHHATLKRIIAGGNT